MFSYIPSFETVGQIKLEFEASGEDIVEGNARSPLFIGTPLPKTQASRMSLEASSSGEESRPVLPAKNGDHLPHPRGWVKIQMPGPRGGLPYLDSLGLGPGLLSLHLASQVRPVISFLKSLGGESSRLWEGSLSLAATLLS